MAMQKISGIGRLGNSDGPGTENKDDLEIGTGESGLKGSASHKTDAKWQTEKVSAADNPQFTQVVNEKAAELKKMFGKNLARIRKKAGYSQLDLSLDIDMTHNFINDLEHGAKGASFQTLLRLSAILKTPVHEFFKSEEKQSSAEDFRYSDPVSQMVSHLHEVIDVWNEKWTKQKDDKNR
jgi:transcriptional regulator with XRE-family HTH domain